MEIRELRSLAVLAELGSITRSAEKLNLSVAAIHNQLKMLENETGVKLYRKVGRRLELTHAAEILLPPIRAMLAQYDEIKNTASDLKQSKRGFLRIGAGPTFSNYVLPLMLQEYSHRYPEVEIFVDAGQSPQLFTALKNDKLDLVILVLSELSMMPQYMIRAIWDFEIVLVSNINYPIKNCSLADLQDTPFISYKQDTFFENLIEGYFLSQNFYPHVTMRFDNADAIKAMIRAGLGVSMLPLWAVKDNLGKDISIIKQNEPPLTAKVALVTRKIRKLPSIIQNFIDIAQSISLS